MRSSSVYDVFDVPMNRFFFRRTSCYMFVRLGRLDHNLETEKFFFDAMLSVFTKFH